MKVMVQITRKRSDLDLDLIHHTDVS